MDMIKRYIAEGRKRRASRSASRTSESDGEDLDISSTAHVHALPNEILAVIFSFLPSDELPVVAKVCMRFKLVIESVDAERIASARFAKWWSCVAVPIPGVISVQAQEVAITAHSSKHNGFLKLRQHVESLRTISQEFEDTNGTMAHSGKFCKAYEKAHKLVAQTEKLAKACLDSHWDLILVICTWEDAKRKEAVKATYCALSRAVIHECINLITGLRSSADVQLAKCRNRAGMMQMQPFTTIAKLRTEAETILPWLDTALNYVA
eukprot:Colp12_sorted_trinity150504_noHs@24806